MAIFGLKIRPFNCGRDSNLLICLIVSVQLELDGDVYHCHYLITSYCCCCSCCSLLAPPPLSRRFWARDAVVLANNFGDCEAGECCRCSCSYGDAASPFASRAVVAATATTARANRQCSVLAGRLFARQSGQSATTWAPSSRTCARRWSSCSMTGCVWCCRRPGPARSECPLWENWLVKIKFYQLLILFSRKKIIFSLNKVLKVLVYW